MAWWKITFHLQNSKDSKIGYSSSEVVRQRYVSFMDMSSSLSHYAEEIVTDEDNTDECEEVEQRNLIRFSRPILAIAALLVLVITLFNFKDSSLTNDGSKQIASERVGEASDYASTAESTVFAVLTNSVGLSWAKDTKHRPKLGQTLEKCILGVDEGSFGSTGIYTRFYSHS